MRDTLVASRYAKALFNVAVEDGKEKEYFEELKGIGSFFKEKEDVLKFITLPIYPKRERKELLESVISSFKPSQPVAEFMRVLFENGRVSYIHQIVEEYQKLLDEKEGIKRGVVFSPYPLDKKLGEKLSELLAQFFKVNKVILSYQEDKDLIGGIRVKVGDTVIDGSLSCQLRKLKEKLLEG